MNQRKELERLCRYITRPAIANERLILNNAGQVVLNVKDALSGWHHAYRHVTTGIYATPCYVSTQTKTQSYPFPWCTRAEC